MDRHELDDAVRRPMASSQRPATPVSNDDDDNTEHVAADRPGLNEQQLDPTDRGPAAWKLLGTAFVFEALLWGFPLSFGVFQNYYSTLPQFAGNRYISVVGTVASGLSYLGAPFIMPLIKRYHKYQRHMIWIGWPLCISGVLIGSFASTLEVLILTQGVAYGVGFLIFYYPILSMVNEYWVVRRGMAYGLLCSASGVSGAVLPVIAETLLNKYGYKVALRVIGIALIVLTGPLIPFLKGRLPVSEQSTTAKTDWSFLRNQLFWVFSVSNVLQGLGYFFPSLYLPSYASSVGLSSRQGALLLALMSVAQTAGQLLFGFLSDRKIPINALAALTTAAAATAALTLWGLGRSLPPLAIFAIVYGFFGGGYTALWARMSTAVSSNPTAMPMIFGLFNFGKGIGNVLAGPISGGLISSARSDDMYGMLKYAGIVSFTGGSMLLSAIAIVSWYARPLLRAMA